MSSITCGELARISRFLSTSRALTSVVRDNVLNSRNVWNNLCLLVVWALTVSLLMKSIWSMADELVHDLLELRILVPVNHHA